MNKNIGVVLLQIAIALYLLISGISGLTNSNAGDLELVLTKINSLFNSSSAMSFAIVILSVIELVAGLFLLMELFTTGLRITDMILFIIIILWVINIVFADFIIPIGDGSTFKNVKGVLNYLSVLSSHLMVLGGLVVVTKKV